MDLVVDANVLFSAAIKESKTSELLFSEIFHLFAPEFLFDEFRKYKEVLLEKTYRTENDFYNFMEILIRRINIIPLEEIKDFIEEAENISPDPKDVPYIALALKLRGSIWSDDKDMKKQNKVPVFSTSEIISMIY